ncbi:hypothetical protein [Corynebacterium variabile]|uniref:hypothetical protein n=1 Tax=Corynebacterium variabile TaxID=1727 RepID=UPI002FE3679B
MAPRLVYDAQRAMRDWLAAGGSEAAKGRHRAERQTLTGPGLIRVCRSGGKWVAELTDADRYYVDHAR